MHVLSAIIAAAVAATASATWGVDVSQATGPSAFSCLKNEGARFAVIRGFMETDRPDPNGVHTVYNAWDGGMSDVDMYLFPAPRGNAAAQANSMLDYLTSYTISWTSGATPPHKIGMVWVDVEAPDIWGSQEANRAFLKEMVSTLQSRGVHVGIYTSESQWGPITGGAELFPSLPLWYAHYDNNPSFSDFAPFGGWSKPSIKQYEGNVNLCGAGIDKNYYP